MLKRLIQFIFILIALLFAMDAKAGIILRPVFNAGLVGYWNFQEGAGNNVYDKSGNGNTGTWNGTAGVINESFEVNPGYDMTDFWTETENAGCTVDEDYAAGSPPDGSQSLRSVKPAGGAGVLYAASSHAFSAEIKKTYREAKIKVISLSDGAEFWVFRSEDWTWNQAGSVSIGRSGSDYKFAFTYYTNGGPVAVNQSNPSSLNLNQWYTVRVMLDADADKIEWWIDGVLQNTITLTGSHNTGIRNVYVGLSTWDNTYDAEVLMDKIKISATGWDEGFWADGKIGEGGSFNGTNDYVEIADTSDLSFGNSSTDLPMTISAWIKMTDATEFKIFEKGEYSSTIEYYFRLGDQGSETDNLIIRIYDANTGAALGREYSTPLTAYEGQWIHVAATYDGSATTAGIKLYLNGVRVDNADYNYSSGYVAMENLSAPVWIGRYSSSYYSNGLIDEMRIYNRALSASEVERVYKLSQPKFLAAPRNGLVGYWSFNEGSGTKVGDMSGNGNHGTIQAGMTQSDWVNGRFGTALNFDRAVNDYVDFGDPTNLQLGNTGTISAWLKYSTLVDHAGVISKNDWCNDRNGYNIGIGAGDQKIGGEIADDDGYNQVVTDHAYNDNQWHYVVFTWDGSFLRIYVDNIEDATPFPQTLTPVSNFYNLYMGKIAGCAGYYYDGLVDEVRIYNRDLDQAEITALYNSGLIKIGASQKNQISNGLVGYWSFNGPDTYYTESTANATAYDRSGYGNDGTIFYATPTIGRVGQAIMFDDSGCWVDVAHNDSINLTGSMSISAWIYPTENMTYYDRIVDKGGGSTSYYFGSGGGTNDLSFWLKNTEVIDTNDNTVVLNTWQHVAVTYNVNTGDAIIYLNGAVVKTGNYTGGIPGSGNDLTIGNEGGCDFALHGKLDELRIYNRVLTAQEVLRLYNMGR